MISSLLMLAGITKESAMDGKSKSVDPLGTSAPDMYVACSELPTFRSCRFLDGPRIPGSHYFDMSDISASKEVFPELNPKGLRTMFPPKVSSMTLSVCNIIFVDKRLTSCRLVLFHESCYRL